jgi:RimJ/RimL family protein N-acetyltransferase
MIARFQRTVQAAPDLRVGRLRLVAITPEMLEAEREGRLDELGRLVRARLTSEWPPVDWEPHVLEFILKQYAVHPETAGWHRYVVLSDVLGLHLDWGRGLARTLVGAVGGFPKSWGDVEIGYSTLGQYQRRGYATAAAQTLVDWLLMQPGVRSVSAQTFTRTPESIKVMERCGMIYDGEGDERSSVRYRRLRDQPPPLFLK